MIEITIPGLPPSPNELNRMHWAKRYKLFKEWKDTLVYLARPKAPKAPYSHVELSFVRGSSRPIDIDNGIAALKPIIDGLKEAKIIIDDNPQVVRTIHFEWQKTKPKEGFIKIIIEPILSFQEADQDSCL